MSFAFFESNRSGNNIFEFFEAGCFSYPLHFHPHIELIYICRGSILVSINNKEYKLDANDFAIVLPNHPHSYIESNDADILVMIFSTNLVDSFIERISNKTFEFPLIKKSNTTLFIKECMLNLKNSNLIEKDTCFIKGYLYTILGYVLREQKLIHYDTKNLDTITQVLNEIEVNYTSNIKLKEIASHLGFSYCYLSHIFKNAIGYNFSCYISNLRINLAKDFLKNKDITITNIAFECGFETLKSFNRTFKELTGLTPTQFKSIDKN